MANPLLKTDIFVPDVEAHVWEDGRIYMYGSFDVDNGTYCSDRYHVYSSDNMIDWVDHGVAFSAGDITWAKDQQVLYAPDCAYRNGWYYLYYCVPNGCCGVARSQNPAGPFTDVGQIENVYGIDPAVLIDDDGKAYLYWGQLTWGKVAQLKDNMTEIIPETVRESLTVEQHEFHEGSSVKKINGKYYFLFADTHRHGNRPTCLGYAVSQSPTEGFEYAGVIIDNFQCDPGVWNNHGSIVCFKGQWYVFYHRSTHGERFLRRVCAEPIYFDENGYIREAEQTTSGTIKQLPAKMLFGADTACRLKGNLRVTVSDSKGVLKGINNGDEATYKWLEFNNEDRLHVTAGADGILRIEVYIGGVYAGEACLKNEYGEKEILIPKTIGRECVTFKFFGTFNSAEFEAFRFD